MPKRPSKDEYYLNIAFVVSQRSTCLKRHYGAVIVKNDRIVSTGYNGAPAGEPNCCDIFEVCPRMSEPHNSGNYAGCPAAHAEQNAIISASKEEMIGATLYLAGLDMADGEEIFDISPCPVCARIIKNAGIKRVVGLCGDIKI